MVRFIHCVKSIRIRSFSAPYFLAFGLNTEVYVANLRIQSECGKIRTRKTPNKAIFYVVAVFVFFLYTITDSLSQYFKRQFLTKNAFIINHQQLSSSIPLHPVGFSNFRFRPMSIGQVHSPRVSCSVATGLVRITS